MERGEDGHQMGHEAMIEVNAPQELLQLLLGGWARHANNGLHLGGKRDHASFGDSVAKELDGGRAEDALLLVDSEARLLEDSENVLQMLGVEFWRGARHQYIIKINTGKVDPAEETIHQALERLCRVFELEWHPQKLKQAEGERDCCLGDVGRGHRDLMVPLDRVQRGENSSGLKFSETFC